jgi:hypothetical protein
MNSIRKYVTTSVLICMMTLALMTTTRAAGEVLPLTNQASAEATILNIIVWFVTGQRSESTEITKTL